MKRRFRSYRDPLAGDDPAGGAAGAEAGAATDGAGAGSEGTILGGAGDGAGAGGELDIPEKFLVKGADGNPDFKAIFGKMAPSYSELEKRLGSIGMPPKSADEYKLEQFLPEGFEAKEEAVKPILAKFHDLGLTNKQAQGVMNVYGETLGGAVASEKSAYEAGVAQLKQTWGDAFEQNLTKAKAAVSVYGTPEERQALLSNPKYANDPVLLRFFAKVGADLSEDKLPAEFHAGGADNIDELRKSEAYLNGKHPDHMATVAKVNAAYKQGYKSKAS
jgi:hypothetical protein